MSEQFRNQLKTYKQKNKIKTPHPKKKRKRNEEKLSQSDLEDLMGVNRPTYKRGRGGAMRQQ